jgi:cell shape-determining protein MreC
MQFLRRPASVLAIALAVCALLALLPERWRAPLKGRVADSLRPGQEAVCWTRGVGRVLTQRVAAYCQSADAAARQQAEIARLNAENRRLAEEVATLRRAAQETTAGAGLLRPRAVEARVLGCQALAWLGRARLLDIGRTAGVESDALVLDCGQDLQLRPGQLVLGEDCVWGRITEVGRCTSLARSVTDVGYRDLVQVVGQTAAARGVRRGPQGVLEGTGSRWAKIGRVEVTEPVEVGDLVYTAAEVGLLARPALVGRLVRVERPVGSGYWELWMEPAVGPRAPERLSVLTAEVNPARVAGVPDHREQEKR